MKEDIKFNIELPGELTEKQIEALLPDFLLKQESQRDYPRAAHAGQMDVRIWQSTRLENNDWKVNGYWVAKD